MTTGSHPAQASYEEAGFSNRIGWGSRPALLLIDVCNAYWTEGSPLDTSSNPASKAALTSILRLVAAARAGQTPLIWTRVEYTEPDMSDAGIFARKAPLLKVFQKGNETGLEAWVAGLEPREGEVVISKRYPSAFFATDLSTRLQLKRVDTLVVCGVVFNLCDPLAMPLIGLQVSTSGCVRASTLDAMCLGFKPMVVGEACGDRTPEVHDANIFDMNAKMADIVPEEEAIQRLRAGWQQ